MSNRYRLSCQDITNQELGSRKKPLGRFLLLVVCWTIHFSFFQTQSLFALLCDSIQKNKYRKIMEYDIELGTIRTLRIA